MTLEAGSSTLEIAYLLEGLPPDQPLHFGVEFNFAGLPAGADDRYFYGHDRHRLGQLGTRLDLADARDSGPGRRVAGHRRESCLLAARPACGPFRSRPSASRKAASSWCTSRSSSQPHWIVEADAKGRWQVIMHLAVDTGLAESRLEPSSVVALAR